MKNISFEIINKLISEVYPFTFEELSAYQNQLDFEWVSRNEKIKWSVPIIQEFYEKWAWEGLEQNVQVFNTLTLGLFFPDKVELPPCKCSRREDFCEDKNCLVNLNKFAFTKSLRSVYPDIYLKILMMCDSGFIDHEMVSDFYNTQNPDTLIHFKVSI